jgi:hypothetical protein
MFGELLGSELTYTIGAADLELVLDTPETLIPRKPLHPFHLNLWLDIRLVTDLHHSHWHIKLTSSLSVLIVAPDPTSSVCAAFVHYLPT